MFARLTHDIPAYAGVAMGDRVALVAAGEAADVEAGRDGRVALLPGGGCEPAPAR